jgi:hypothetical protein
VSNRRFSVLRPHFLALIALFGHSLFAQQFRISVSGTPVTCSYPDGRPVAFYSDPTLNDVGNTTQRGITLNPNVLSTMSAHLKLFWVGHECGHAHIPTSKEMDADCWSAKTGVSQGWFDASDADELGKEMAQNPGDSSHPPGPERVANVRACMQQASGLDSTRSREETGSGAGQGPIYQRRGPDRGSLPVPKDPTPRNKDTSSMCSKLEEVVNDAPDFTAIIGDPRTPHSTFATTKLPLADKCLVSGSRKPAYECIYKKNYLNTLIAKVAACFPDATKTGGGDLTTIRLKPPSGVFMMFSTDGGESYIRIMSH